MSKRSNTNLRMLYVGGLWRGCTGLERKLAFEKIGLKVISFDTDPYARNRNRIELALTHKLARGPAVWSLNRDLVEFVKGQEYDLVWVSRGIWIYSSTVEALKKNNKALVVHCNMDDPFGYVGKHDVAVKDNIVMVERLYNFFQKQQVLPSHLHDPQFFKEWKVWASSNFILSHYRHKKMGRPNQFDAIRAVFEEEGLGSELRSLILKRFLPYIFASLVRKSRIFLNLPDGPPLFGSRFCRT